jgi:hypothetical protein
MDSFPLKARRPTELWLSVYALVDIDQRAGFHDHRAGADRLFPIHSSRLTRGPTKGTLAAFIECE